MSNRLKKLKEEILELADVQKAKRDLSFFKTGKGEYGEGDQFLGIAVPILRKLARQYEKEERDEGSSGGELAVVEKLLYSKYNEERLLGLMILSGRFEKAGGERKKEEEIYDFYLRHIGRVNNWNLVDFSARSIVGRYLRDKDREILREWGRTENLWLRRIGIVATHCFIKENEFEDTLQIAEILLNDKEDLIHKAVGWMLREVGKMDEAVLKKFLKKYQKLMPRTMLRYAIERLTVEDKERFMKGIYR